MLQADAVQHIIDTLVYRLTYRFYGETSKKYEGSKKLFHSKFCDILLFEEFITNKFGFQIRKRSFSDLDQKGLSLT